MIREDRLTSETLLSVQGFQESPGPVGGRVWLALHGPLLFLSAGPEPWAPKLGDQRVGDHLSDFLVWHSGSGSPKVYS